MTGFHSALLVFSDNVLDHSAIGAGLSEVYLVSEISHRSFTSNQSLEEAWLSFGTIGV